MPTLPFAGVFLLCAGILFARSLWEQHQTKFVRRMASLCLATALCGGAGGMVFFRQAEATQLEPPLSDLHLLPGVTEVWTMWRSAATPPPPCSPAPTGTSWSPTGKRDSEFMRRFWGFGWMPRCGAPPGGPGGPGWRSGRIPPAGRMEPVEGYPACGAGRRGRGELWLLRRDTLVLRVKNDLEPLDEDWLADMLAQMEEEGR